MLINCCASSRLKRKQALVYRMRLATSNNLGVKIDILILPQRKLEVESLRAQIGKLPQKIFNEKGRHKLVTNIRNKWLTMKSNDSYIYVSNH